MILYNMRYRGPYEYDKFVLNIMQFANEAKRLKGQLGDSTFSELDTLVIELTDIIEAETQEDSLTQKLLALQLQASI